jgi:trimeric autotransporter adhesin
VRDEKVFAGGSFSYSGPISVPNVAQWNGTAWSGMGSGFDGTVNALVVGPDGSVYAGGAFTRSGGTLLSRVAKWDGTTWQPLGSGFDDHVNALAFDTNGKLYAGGRFKQSGSTPISHIAVWNGTEWSALGAGVETNGAGAVNAIAIYDGKLTVGGEFDRSGANVVEGVASWDGTAWTSVGGGVRIDDWKASVYGLSVRGKELYVGGNVRRVGSVTDGGAGQEVQRIAMWNGTSWSDLKGGTSPIPATLLVTKDYLWVGGSFTFVGNVGSYYIARYWFAQP